MLSWADLFLPMTHTSVVVSQQTITTDRSKYHILSAETKTEASHSGGEMMADRCFSRTAACSVMRFKQSLRFYTAHCVLLLFFHWLKRGSCDLTSLLWWFYIITHVGAARIWLTPSTLHTVVVDVMHYSSCVLVVSSAVTTCLFH